MNRKKMLKTTLAAGLLFLALGGWLLHLRIHPLIKDADFVIPFISGIVSVFCLPLLFWFRRTIALAYIVNGFLVIIGTITMAQFSIAKFKGPVTAINIILNTTLADIAILWGKFAVGKALFDLQFLKSDTDATAKGRFFRYPNMGWWLAHLFALALVYTLGGIIWK
ncbi:MAG: hypothetical protein A3I73_01545 [Omnitrophica bacterium RIFCSPLOWO2_02_FULL_45_16]|nr:MAG: hypothetical protein A3C51_06320 [Omnitrophica bacterium RIFCSPHIGHO2_02_FULL_46_20]OGW92650.1 MAG: hypothetical protein A3G36_01435 [Omnitrophica bacterium RIFCSPLOWO2_12_FULL_45_13]OGW93032.1 MAG: hypothetical protein A3K16_03965 [Omnitrophica bacterium RIFCSPLOWO2_01_FULL_45_24]OGX00097.1 MAG: hypothetical protein A3I73_01545 [Omnitrophica bacterium RIFCSPLOWO2_02_FULL_45_16]